MADIRVQRADIPGCDSGGQTAVYPLRAIWASFIWPSGAQVLVVGYHTIRLPIERHTISFGPFHHGRDALSTLPRSPVGDGLAGEVENDLGGGVRDNLTDAVENEGVGVVMDDI